MLKFFLLVPILFLFPFFAEGSDVFGRLDADANGGITMEEFMKAMPDMREKAFQVIDKDGDGSINLAEWQAFSMTHNQGDSGMKPGGGKPGTQGTAKDDALLIRPPENKP